MKRRLDQSAKDINKMIAEAAKSLSVIKQWS